MGLSNRFGSLSAPYSLKGSVRVLNGGGGVLGLFEG